MVPLEKCINIMKKGVRTTQWRKKTAFNPSTATSDSAESVIKRRTMVGRSKGGSNNTPLGRLSVQRRRLSRRLTADDRVREYLLGLPEDKVPISTTSAPVSKTELQTNDQPFRGDHKEDCLTAEVQGSERLKTGTRRDAFVSSSAILKENKSEHNFGNHAVSQINSQSEATRNNVSARKTKHASRGKELHRGQKFIGDEGLVKESDVEFEYKKKVDKVIERINLFQIEPFFSKWKVSGFKQDKVLIRGESSMENKTEIKEVTPEFVQYIKERDAAREEAKKALEELRETQCRLYDAVQEIERLEKKNKGTKKTTAPKKKPPAQSKNLKVPTATSETSSGVSSARTSTVNSVRTGIDGVYHPPVDGIDPDINTCEYYWKIAEMFPTLPMFYILDAEKKFMNADLDCSGSIDKVELDKVLNDTVDMFTPNQVDSIFKEVDSNNSEYLDFYEVLVVLNKLYSRRRTNLPPSLQQNYSRACNLQ